MVQRKTKQRATLLEALRDAGRPVTRAELWELAKVRLPSIGFATVSRAINDWVAEYSVVRVDYPGQPSRYEPASHREHPHFLCTRCRKAFDLEIPMPDIALPAKLPGYRIQGYEILLFGECENCVQANAGPSTG